MPYDYPQTNTELIKQLKLEPHPEGGHFALTWAAEEKVASPFADGAERALASCIYYLLSVKAESGGSAVARFHLNQSATMHTHHAGRSLYTLVRAREPLGTVKAGEKPEIRQVVLGSDLATGEQRQLLAGSGWWKVSEVPPEDRRKCESGELDGERTGTLISEVVTPAFDWRDHHFLTLTGLRDLFPDDEDLFQRFQPYVKPDEEDKAV